MNQELKSLLSRARFLAWPLHCRPISACASARPSRVEIWMKNENTLVPEPCAKPGKSLVIQPRQHHRPAKAGRVLENHFAERFAEAVVAASRCRRPGLKNQISYNHSRRQSKGENHTSRMHARDAQPSWPVRRVSEGGKCSRLIQCNSERHWPRITLRTVVYIHTYSVHVYICTPDRHGHGHGHGAASIDF